MTMSLICLFQDSLIEEQSAPLQDATPEVIAAEIFKWAKTPELFGILENSGHYAPLPATSYEAIESTLRTQQKSDYSGFTLPALAKALHDLFSRANQARRDKMISAATRQFKDNTPSHP